ncbi:MAG: hypothetical protein ACSLFL_06265 [Alphaproteobacteria bacterium]
MIINETWHTFMLRKTLLTHWSVCFDFSFPNTSFRAPIIRNTAASLLYVDLLSLLDEAIQIVMTPEDYARGRKMKSRIEMLKKNDQLFDFESFDAMNNRRNEIGHQIDKGATVDELDNAVAKVKKQLVNWKLIDDLGAYEFTFDKSTKRGSVDEGHPFESDLIIRININGTTYLEMKQTQSFGGGVNATLPP